MTPENVILTNSLSLDQKMIIFYVLKRRQNSLPLSFSVFEMLKANHTFCKISVLKRLIDGIKKQEIILDVEGETRRTHWFEKVEFSEDNNFLEFKIRKDLEPYIRPAFRALIRQPSTFLPPADPECPF